LSAPVFRADQLGDPSLVLTGHFRPDEEWQYRHLPFEVPAGTQGLHIRYSYTDRIASDPTAMGGNTLDIGLFDERGTAAGSPGYRGWSGSDKNEFTIIETWATPPYKPGPIGAGEWNVLLGPYKVHPERGLDYRVEIWLNPDLPPEEPVIRRTHKPFVLRKVAAIEPGWYRGDLHSHTMASDGDSWMPDVMHAAAERGLDFLGVTDHNGAIPPDASGLRDDVQWPVLVPGIEVTTYAGHFNVWGAGGEWFDFRDPSDEGMQRAMDAALAVGALVCVNHPKPFGPPWLYPNVTGNHAVEIWNGPWQRLNNFSLTYWDRLLQQGKRPVAIGGSDMHKLAGLPSSLASVAVLGEPTTWVKVEGELTAQAVMEAIRSGRCYVSGSPDGPQLILEREGDGIRLHTGGGVGSVLTLIGPAGTVHAEPITSADQEWRLPFPEGLPYVRAQIIGIDGIMQAVSNPIWAEESVSG
jgi:hypothetical protein